MRRVIRALAARYPLRLEALRFALVGGINTLLTLALYQMALCWTGEKVAWTVAWAAGIGFVAVAYPKFVFTRGRMTWRRCLANSAYYVLSYGISLALLAGLVALGVHPRPAALLVVVGMVPINFVCSCLIFTAKTA